MTIVLYLGPSSRLIDYLLDNNYKIIHGEESNIPTNEYDCIVSYGYRHKIPMYAVESVNGKAINLHISYLPWNRGANPNYWSWYDNTVKGVTIHYIDEGFDTGDIIAQNGVPLSPDMTLEGAYEQLKWEVEMLFMRIWPRIWEIPRQKQVGEGSFHAKKDSIYLPEGWQTKCRLIQSIGGVERFHRNLNYIPINDEDLFKEDL